MCIKCTLGHLAHFYTLWKEFCTNWQAFHAWYVIYMQVLNANSWKLFVFICHKTASIQICWLKYTFSGTKRILCTMESQHVILKASYSAKNMVHNQNFTPGNPPQMPCQTSIRPMLEEGGSLPVQQANPNSGSFVPNSLNRLHIFREMSSILPRKPMKDMFHRHIYKIISKS